MNLDDDRPPADPLAVIARERATAERGLTPDPRMFSWPWGVAWLVGFTLFFLRFGPDGRVFVDLPGWLPLTTLLGLMIAAGVVTGVAGARAGRHVSGPSSRQGALYGVSWSIGFAGMSVVLSQFTGLLSEAMSGLLWAGVMVGLTGVLHMAGGAAFDDRHLFVLGAGISVVNVAGVLAGPGWHSLVVAVAGGGGMLLAGLLGWLRWRR
ncbi:transporter [Spirilliplanes yamanashiensis]|uniref:Uncharacterized protein n=1 Tax=Spirilliplanes yamanashiensis TaxID=42233 RepID=A0A8J4DJU1_9ACTN|nr:transporter [Spirilliplanes yamanashiensis]MDP9815343.1 hypothetical protein [Spirilliplanes yamanashiensis]GIJ03598.1 hypothetical protein Sya03_29500 [Spirilliplanes yamanashiensis]